MDETKRNLSDIESNNDRRKKIRTNNKKRIHRSSFEDFSNEIVYEILDFLDGCDAHEAFSNLNARFNRIVNCPSRLLKINLSFTSKSIFEYRCKKIISENIQHIVSLHLSGEATINLFLKLFSINAFIRLESLILNQIKSDELEPLFACLILLSRLFSLSIDVIDTMKNEDLIFGLIFQLPVLEYINCRIRTKPLFRCPYLRRIPDHIIGQQNNTIKYLVTNHYCNLDQLGPRSYMPKLRRLSCSFGWNVANIQKDMPMIPFDLTHICLTEACYLPFDQFELFISKLCPHVQMLCITILDDKNYLDADRWQCLIVQHMRHLRIFDFQHRCEIASDDYQYNTYHAIIHRFSSVFWLEHQWYFAHQHSGCSKYRYGRFYSIQPYRRYKYHMSPFENDYICPYRDSGLNMARQVFIDSYQSLIHCLLRFPRATKFTFEDRDNEDNYLPITDLNHIVPLAHLNQLVIGWRNLEPVQLLELLHHAFNVHSLELIWFSHLPIPSLSSKQVDNDHAISNRNNVVQLIIRSKSTLQQLHFLMSIFPHIKHLQLNITYNDHQSIIKFLLLGNRNNNRHLFSLCLNIGCTNCDIVKDVQTFIDNENLLDNYSITFSNEAVYLWW